MLCLLMALLPKDKNGKAGGNRVSLYALKTFGRATAKLEGDAVSECPPGLMTSMAKWK